MFFVPFNAVVHKAAEEFENPDPRPAVALRMVGDAVEALVSDDEGGLCWVDAACLQVVDVEDSASPRGKPWKPRKIGEEG